MELPPNIGAIVLLFPEIIVVFPEIVSNNLGKMKDESRENGFLSRKNQYHRAYFDMLLRLF